MQHIESVQPARLRVVEQCACSAIAEHRPLAGNIDEHDHGAAATLATDHRFDPFVGEHLQQMPALNIVADLADEPCAPSGMHHVDGNICGASATSAMNHRVGVGGDVDRAAKANDDVFDKITNRPDHARQRIR